MTKTEFRTKYKNIRKNISIEQSKNKSDIISNKLIESGILDDAKSVFIYLSYGREVNTINIVNYLFENNKTVLIPKCNIQSETMIPVEYKKNDMLNINSYGIKENDSKNEYTENIDIIIVPGIAFDASGNRIGHGKGYYDKFVVNTNAIKIGLCYSDCFLHEEIPHDVHDIPMDMIVTDREVFKINCNSD